MSAPPRAQAPRASSPPPPSRTRPSEWLRSPATVAGLLWVLATLALIALAYKRLFPGELVDADAMDYAQIARHLASGQGFSTGILRPLAVSAFPPASGLSVPDISHAPLYPFVLAVAFAAHGGHGGAPVVVLTDLLLFALSAAGVYGLARTLLPTDGPWPALLATGLYVLGGSALGYAASGLPTALATLTLTGLLIALHRAHEVSARPATPGSELRVGVLLGLCFLAQYSLLLLVVPTLLYVYASRAPARALRGIALCAAGFLLVSGAWLLRMAHVTGNPFFSLRLYDLMANTADYPGPTSIYRSLMPADGLFAFFFGHLPEMLAKAGHGLGQYQAHLLEAFSVFVVAGAAASLLWRFGDARLSILRAYVALCLLLLIVVTAFFAPSVQTIAPFAPVLCVLAVGFALGLMRGQEWQPLSQRVTLWTWGLLASVGVLALLAGPGGALNPVQKGISMTVPGPNAPPFSPQVWNQIQTGAIMTDTPWEVTWHTGQPALWLPRDNQVYEAVAGRGGANGPAAAPTLLLTPYVAAYNDGSDEGTAWLLLSTHPQVWQAHGQALAQAQALPQQFAARAALLQKMIAAHDPRVRLTRADLARQMADVQQTMPARIRQAREHAQTEFTASYGPISEVVQDYLPVAAQTEVNHASSTLFVRSDILKGGRP